MGVWRGVEIGWRRRGRGVLVHAPTLPPSRQAPGLCPQLKVHHSKACITTPHTTTAKPALPHLVPPQQSLRYNTSYHHRKACIKTPHTTQQSLHYNTSYRPAKPALQYLIPPSKACITIPHTAQQSLHYNTSYRPAKPVLPHLIPPQQSMHYYIQYYPSKA